MGDIWKDRAENISRSRKIFLKWGPVAPHSANCREQPVSALPGLGLQAGTTAQKLLFACLILLMWVLGSPACTANTFQTEPPSPQLPAFVLYKHRKRSPHLPCSATQMREQRSPQPKFTGPAS